VIASAWFLEHAWLIPVIPAVAFAAIILVGKRLPMKGSELGLLSMAASVVLAIGTAVQWIQRVNAADGGYTEPVIRSWTWWQNDGTTLTIGQHVDGLSVMLLALVSFISLLVQVFSLEYVRGDRRYTHFFAALTLFSAGMLGMVLAENMVQVILGWEIMGLCSFMLIGHWWEEEPNSRAALKAFFTVRVGDVGLLVGTAMLYFGSNDWAREHGYGSGFNIRGICAWALSGDGSHSMLLWTAVALFIACIGKSGQFPLHTWLPDAMAGPTPVSSLLHSSTMVVAGVFLVARLYPVFWEGFSIPDSSANLIVVIAAITIVASGLLAFVQNDIKKVLAYSTVGQLGYMMLGLGAGAWLPAVFHIFTHAFFKCCLFLCAGSVSHSGSHHSFDMKQDMGGLRKAMPVTFAAWTVSAIALCGMFPFSGFFSKDEIIDYVGHNGYTTFMWIALGGAVLTAMYTARATYLTFFGEPRGGAAHGAHESPKLILAPIAILAVLAFGSGWVNPAFMSEGAHRFAEYVEPYVAHGAEHGEEVAADSDHEAAAGSDHEADAAAAAETDATAAAETDATAAAETDHASEAEHEVTAPEYAEFPPVSHGEFKWWPNAIRSQIIAGGSIIVGLAFCAALYGRRDRRLVGLTQRVAPLRWGYAFLANKYYLDALYENVVVRAVAHPIAKAANWINQNVIDGIVNGAGVAGKRTGEWVYRRLDQGVVDGAVNGAGWIAEETGQGLRPVQSGKVSQYGALLFGAAAVGAIVLVIVNV